MTHPRIPDRFHHVLPWYTSLTLLIVLLGIVLSYSAGSAS